MRLFVAAFIIAGVCFSSPSIASFVPMDHRAYQDIDALAVRGHQIIPSTTLKPYSRRQIAEGLHHLSERETALSEYEQQLYSRLSAEFSREIEELQKTGDNAIDAAESSRIPVISGSANPRLLFQLNPMTLRQPRSYRLPATTRTPTDRVRNINTLDLTLHVTPRLSVIQRFETDTDGRWDNDYAGPVRLESYRRGVAGHVEYAYASYETNFGTVSFGRMPIVWGPERQGNLLLSENAPAPTVISATAHLGWLHASAFAGELEKYKTDSQYIRRYLSGHRVTFTPTHWLEVGFGETVVYGSADQGFSLKWGNPFTWFYGDEVNEEARDRNILASADVVLRPAPGIEVYGVLLVDDIRLHGSEPDRIGWTAGTRWETPLGFDRVGIGLEYTRINRWTYIHLERSMEQTYFNKRASLGHFLGPDGDALFLNTRWESAHDWAVAGLFTYRRLGETTILTPIPREGMGSRDDPFPFGTVESSASWDIIVSAPPIHGAYISVALLTQTVRNEGNEKAARRWDAGFRIDLDWHIPFRI